MFQTFDLKKKMAEKCFFLEKVLLECVIFASELDQCDCRLSKDFIKKSQFTKASLYSIKL